MKTQIIKCDKLRDEIFEKIKADILLEKENHGKVPGIAFIGFLDVPLGKFNIPFHAGIAKQLGFNVFNEIQAEGTTEEDLFELIDKLNDNDDVHAIEVLQPLPNYLNPLRIINKINPAKEMEGFHPMNMMKTLFPDLFKTKYPMCLPTALEAIFIEYDIKPNKNDEWILVLDDEFFQNPLVNMVTRTAFTKAVPDDCPLTIVNKQDDNLINHCRRADFLIIVSKDAEFIKPEWLKRSVFIIDIYSNLVKEVVSKKYPERLIPIIRGGVNVESVNNIASGILPIPGGLMSVVLAVMFRNTVDAFKKNFQGSPAY